MRATLILAFLAFAPIAYGDTHEAEGWRVTASTAPGQPKTKVGQHAALEVVLEARGDYHLNDDYPLNFKASDNAAVTFDVARVEKGAAKLTPCTQAGHACRANVPVGYVAKSAGPMKIAGTLSFSACNDAHCLIEKVPVTVDVAVSP